MDHQRFLVAFTLLTMTPLFWPAADVYAVPLTVTKNADLAFGSFVQASSGTITINTSGARQVSGGVIPLSTATFSSARFTIRGNSGTSYTLTLPSSFIISAGGNSMTVSALVASVPLTGNLPTTGSLAFTVGGTLNVGATQPSGSYSGAVIISVNR